MTQPNGVIATIGKAVMALVAVAAIGACALRAPSMEADAAKARKPAAASQKGTKVIDKIVKTDDEWKKLMSPQEFQVMRKQGTEAPFTGQYWNNHEKGTYVCAACGQPLFSSDTKFESGTGWPSFYQPLAKEDVSTEQDSSLGMDRTEAHCPRCGGHLGHVFDDGPKPTGLRYCMNSVSMKFIPAGKPLPPLVK